MKIMVICETWEYKFYVFGDKNNSRIRTGVVTLGPFTTVELNDGTLYGDDKEIATQNWGADKGWSDVAELSGDVTFRMVAVNVD